ncbi:MAG: putative maltokinase [Acidobacteriota bacterium]|nr:putative maltokinase [Acidobacteriota bacterium]
MSGNISSVGELEIDSLTGPFDETFAAKLGALLPEHVANRRWYRAKTRTISRIAVEDVLSVPRTNAHLLILKISYTDADADRYLLPVSITAQSGQAFEEVVAKVSSRAGEHGVLYSALGDEPFRGALLNAIVCEETLTGSNGALVATRTSALAEGCDPANLGRIPSFVSRAEQSNTSIIYRDRYILKLFRKLEAGVNPDVEIGRFLTEHGFKNTPAVLGALEYRAAGGANYGAGILQQFVPNKGDAWKFTLDSLGEFFARALSGKRDAPDLPTEHPLDLIGQSASSELRALIGPYLESAALLGKRTAEMHAALSNPNAAADFKPEAFTREEGHRLYQDLVGQADMAFELLRRKQTTLSGPVADSARELLRIEGKVTERFAGVQNTQITAVRIRHHGDYHLGQVLYTGQDFMIIDFEGEPARPLEARRAKALAMRDVAGMIRSFQYAAFAALFGQVPGVPADAEARRAVEGWAAAWNAYVSSTYLRSYFEHAGDAAFVPSDWGERRILLDAFLLQKALYEAAYELNNRPDWLAIPLRGILSLMR